MNKWFDVDEKTVGIKYKLHGKYLTLLFDKEDYALISQFVFQICTNGYAQCRKKGTKDKWIMVHNLIIQPPAGKEVDHINGNRLDNRKSKMRICTHAQNSRNQRSKKKYKGVYIVYGIKPYYHAQIRVNGKAMHIASCRTPEKAAEAYNKAALKYFGEYANLNIIE